MIRAATEDDLPEIARLGALFHEQAQWADVVDYSVDDCAASLGAFMDSGAFLAFVAEQDGEIVGMVGGVVSPVYFNRGHVSGEELFWWVTDKAAPGTGTKLLVALEDAARERGCASWQMKSLARLNADRMAGVYERRGYRASEHSFIKRL